MEAKEYLNKIKILDVKVKNKRLEIEDIHNQMKGMTGISYEPKEGVSGTINNKSPQERLIHKYIEYQNELNDIINELFEYKKQAMKLIDKINKAEYVDVLYKRYIHYMKWEQIAIDMNYTYRSVLKIHGQALKEFDKILKLDTKIHIQTC